MALWVAGRVPQRIKRFVHQHSSFDRLARRSFASAVKGEGGTLPIESGPLAGVKLATSEHVSHAHIRGTYEANTQIAIDRCVQPGSVCYDLGASIGYMTLVMARKARKVYAFEPAPHAAAELVKHMAANGFGNVEVVPSPVSDCEREVKFGLSDVAYGSAIVRRESSPWPCLTLKTITLDAFIAAHEFPDFIKIDVEGEEGRVLLGARQLVSRKHTVFCCELHGDAVARQVVDFFNGQGYEVTDLQGKPFTTPQGVIPGELQIIARPRPAAG